MKTITNRSAFIRQCLREMDEPGTDNRTILAVVIAKAKQQGYDSNGLNIDIVKQVINKCRKKAGGELTRDNIAAVTVFKEQFNPNKNGRCNARKTGKDEDKDGCQPPRNHDILKYAVDFVRICGGVQEAVDFLGILAPLEK